MDMILLAIFSIIFLILAIKRLDWALLLIIAALPSYLIRFNIAGLPLTWLEVMIVTVGLVFVAKNYLKLANNIKINWSKGAIGYRYPFDWEIALFLLVAFGAALVAGGTNSTSAGLSTGALGIFKAYFFEAIFFYLVLVNVLGNKRENLPKMIWAVAISALGVSLVAWYQGLVDMEFLNPVWSQQNPPRATSFFPYANAVGLYLAPIIVLIVAYIKDLWINCGQKRLYEIIALASIVLMSAFSVYFARSEGAMLGVLVGVVIIGLFSSPSAPLRTGAMKIGVIGLLLALALVMAYPQTSALVYEKATLSDLAGEIRKQQWRETRKMLMSSPQNFFLGVGLSNYPEAVKPFHQEGIFYDFDRDPDFQKNLKASAEYRATHWQPVDVYQYPHNIFLNFWSELGLLGMLLFGWLLLKFLYYASLLYSKTGDFLALGLLASMICVLVHGLVDVPYFKNDLSVLWWLLFAMLATLKLHYERSITKNNRR